MRMLLVTKVLQTSLYTQIPRFSVFTHPLKTSTYTKQSYQIVGNSKISNLSNATGSINEDLAQNKKEMKDKALDRAEVAEVVAVVVVGTLVAVAVGVVVWGLTKLVVGVGARVAWGLTKLVSSSSSSGLEEKLDTDHYTPEKILEANDGRQDRWRFPACGKLKMNTDGSVTDSQKGIGGPAGFGVVIRDESGSWIMGFYGRLKDCPSVEAELLAIYKGLQFIQGCDFGKVFEIESDCEPAVNLIKGKTQTKLPIKEIAKECNMMVLRTGSMLEHVGNKANKVADEMAQRGRDQKDRFVPFCSPPDQKIESWRVADVASARSEN